MKDVAFNKYSKDALEQIPKGAFLSVATGGKENTMTIGWGSIGVMWGRPVFTVGVRPSRYTYDLMEESKEFSVSIPLNQSMKKALTYCGSVSGRDEDKFASDLLTKGKGKQIESPIVEDCHLFYECKIVGKHKLVKDTMEEALKERYYPHDDYHMMYYGEIISCYKKES